MLKLEFSRIIQSWCSRLVIELPLSVYERSAVSNYELISVLLVVQQGLLSLRYSANISTNCLMEAAICGLPVTLS